MIWMKILIFGVLYKRSVHVLLMGKRSKSFLTLNEVILWIIRRKRLVLFHLTLPSC